MRGPGRIDRTGPPGAPGRASPRLRGARGDTLVEVLVSSLILAVIVLGTLAGLDALNRSTSLSRDRSQADALAQQEQEVLRSEPVTKLAELNRSRSVTLNGTTFTIKTTSEYINDAKATSSCNSSTSEADEIKTLSEVSWPTMGAAKPIVESSLISPPPGTLLIVQVSDPVAKVAGAAVTATGPTSASNTTSTDGCALMNITPGEYAINATKAGYVDPNGYTNTNEDNATIRLDYLTAGTTIRVGYALAPAAKLKIRFSGAEGDQATIFNPGMSEPRTFGTLGTYGQELATPQTIFPFNSAYAVYAGNCPSDLPTANAQESNPELKVEESGGEVTVPVVPVRVNVQSGTSEKAAGEKLNGAKIKIVDTGCSVTREYSTASGGVGNRGLPFGKFSFCVSNANKKWSGTFENKSTEGATWTTVPNGGVNASGVAQIYLGTNPSGSPTGVTSGSC
jgi:Tfp pilus assembly protein PilV